MAFALLLAFAVAPAPGPAEIRFDPTGHGGVVPAWPAADEAPGPILRCGDRYRSPRPHSYRLPVGVGENAPLSGSDPNFLLYPPAHQPGLENLGETASSDWQEIERETLERERLWRDPRMRPSPPQRGSWIVSAGMSCVEFDPPWMRPDPPTSLIELAALSHPRLRVYFDALGPGNPAECLSESVWNAPDRKTLADHILFMGWDMTGYADMRPLPPANALEFPSHGAVVNEDMLHPGLRRFGLTLASPPPPAREFPGPYYF